MSTATTCPPAASVTGALSAPRTRMWSAAVTMADVTRLGKSVSATPTSRSSSTTTSLTPVAGTTPAEFTDKRPGA